MSKFRHSKNSARAPKLFQEAAIILKKLSNGGSFNSLIFKNWLRDPQGLTALVTKASQYRSLIDRVIDSIGLLDLEPNLDIWLVRIFIAHLCFGGKQRITGASPAVKAVLKYRNEIQEAVVREDKYGLRALNRVKVGKPRYVRVNTLKISTEEFIRILKDEGYGELVCPDTYDKFLQLVEDTMIEKKSKEIFMRDFHVKDMLVFPRDTFFQHHPAYREGKIILQDKASCLQSCCVNPPPGSIVLDMCSAPGMKTSLYAAMIQNTGKIYAIERSEFRFKDMQNILKSLGATCVTTINNDAGVIGPETCENVEYIVVDPSCSGSGMSGRAKLEDLELQFQPQHQQTSTSPDKRIQKLQNLQTYLLKHALSNFPLARCVVYSTCSTDSLENEAVVEKCLNCARLNGFGVVDLSERLSGWRHFGHPSFRCGPRTVYTMETDLVNGGFFAVFEKEKEEVKKEVEEVKKEEEDVVVVVKKEEEEEKKEEMTEQDLVIQLSVKLLNPLSGNTVLNLSNSSSIQATTTLIQQKMQDIGKIYILNGKKLPKYQEKFVGKSVEVKKLAALESSDANCRGVNRVLVFPESSGSTPANTPLSPEDLHQKFASNQFSLLRHVLTTFSQAKRVVYATTSMHPAENEEIIDALQVVAKFHGFNQVDATARVGGNWQNNRPSMFHCSEKCLMKHEEDTGKGLFIAVFERDDDVEGLEQAKNGQMKGRLGDGEAEEGFRENGKNVPRSAFGAKNGLVKGKVRKKSGQESMDSEDLTGVSGSAFCANSAALPSMTCDVPFSATSADSVVVPNVTEVSGYSLSGSEFGSSSEVLPRTVDYPRYDSYEFITSMKGYPYIASFAASPNVPSTTCSAFVPADEIPALGEDSAILPKVAHVPKFTCTVVKPDPAAKSADALNSATESTSAAESSSLAKSTAESSLIAKPAESLLSAKYSSLQAEPTEHSGSDFVFNFSFPANSGDVSPSEPAINNLPLITNSVEDSQSKSDTGSELVSQEPAHLCKSPPNHRSVFVTEQRSLFLAQPPISVPEEDSDQVSKSADVAEVFPSQLEFLNESGSVPMSVPDEDSIQVSNSTDFAEEIPSQLEFSNALKSITSLKCVSKVLDKSRRNVSASGGFFFIDKEGNMCGEDSHNEIGEIKEVRDCDSSVADKRQTRRQRQKEKKKNWIKRQRKLIELNKKKNAEADGSLDVQTSSINPASSNVGNVTKDVVDGAVLMKKNKKNKWTKERKLMAKEARKAKAAKKIDPPISSYDVGNFQTDIVSLGSEFFVIDRQGKMEDGAKGNGDVCEGEKEEGLMKEDGLENLKRRNGDEYGNERKKKKKMSKKIIVDAKTFWEWKRKKNKRQTFKDRQGRMEDGAKGNGDDCEGEKEEGLRKEDGLENLKRRNGDEYGNERKKKKKMSKKIIVDAKTFWEWKRKKNKRQTYKDRQGRIEDDAKRNGDDCEGEKEEGLRKEDGLENLKRRNGNKDKRKKMTTESYNARKRLYWERFVRSVQKK